MTTQTTTLAWWLRTRRYLTWLETCVRAEIDADISVSALLTLVVAADGPQAHGTIARRLGVSSASMTEIVDSLTKRGLAERQPVPGDRRSYHLVPTAAGLELAERVRRVISVLEVSS